MHVFICFFDYHIILASQVITCCLISQLIDSHKVQLQHHQYVDDTWTILSLHSYVSVH